MTATAVRAQGHTRRRQHPALSTALERRLLRLSARLASHTVSLREATDELYGIRLRAASVAAHASAARMPAPLGDAYVQTAISAALLEVRLDEEASALAIARAERPLGGVLVLPDGTREGAKPAPARAPLLERDLW